MTARLTWGDEQDLIPEAERCDACPVGCRECTGERSGCECTEHDTPGGDPAFDPERTDV